MRFHADYSEILRIQDREIELRLLRPGDKPRMVIALSEMSEESKRLRFLAPKDTLSEEELRYLTELDMQDHLAIVAGEIDPIGRERGLALARFVRTDHDPRVAEAAIVVLDDVQNLGLGGLLMARLAAAAAERGIRYFIADVLAENTHAAALLSRMNPTIVEGERLGLDPEVMRYVLRVTTDAGPEPETERRSLLAALAEGKFQLSPFRLLKRRLSR